MSYHHFTQLHKPADIEAEYTDEHILPEDEQLISCEVCIESVPLSEAQISEASDYVAYFCGLECYEQWVTQSLHDKT